MCLCGKAGGIYITSNDSIELITDYIRTFPIDKMNDTKWKTSQGTIEAIHLHHFFIQIYLESFDVIIWDLYYTVAFHNIF